MPRAWSSDAIASARRPGGGGATGGDHGGAFGGHRGQLRRLFTELGEAVVGALELGEPGSRVVAERDDVGIGLAVLALQGSQGGEPLTDLLQPLRVGGERLAVGANVMRELARLGGERGSPLGELGGLGVELGDVAERLGGDTEGISGGALVTAECPLGRLPALEEPLHVPQTRLLGRYAPGLAWFRQHGIDLAHLIGEQVELTFAVARRLA